MAFSTNGIKLCPILEYDIYLIMYVNCIIHKVTYSWSPQRPNCHVFILRIIPVILHVYIANTFPLIIMWSPAHHKCYISYYLLSAFLSMYQSVFVLHVRESTHLMHMLHMCLCLYPSCETLYFTGLWTWHHLQLWKGILHARWTHGGRGSVWDKQEECAQGHSCAGPAAGG